MDLTEEFTRRFTTGDQALAVFVLEQIRLLKIAALDGLATGVSCDHQEVLVSIEV
jgi:hypothetical protein